MPSIHRSSFDAGSGDSLVDGFLDQTTNVLDRHRGDDRARAPGGLVDGRSRASTSCPGMLSVASGRRDGRRSACSRSQDEDGARGALLDPRRRVGRPERPVKKYLERLDDIRRLQDYHRRASAGGGRPGDREHERRRHDQRRDRARARAGRRSWSAYDRDGRRSTVEDERRRAAASPASASRSPARPSGRRSRRRAGSGATTQQAAEEAATVGHGAHARRAADRGSRRDRRRGGLARARDASSASAADPSISRSIRSKAAASSRAAATARCR